MSPNGSVAQRLGVVKSLPSEDVKEVEARRLVSSRGGTARKGCRHKGHDCADSLCALLSHSAMQC